MSRIEEGIKKKIEHIGAPLKTWDISINYGIKTGFNDAFIINEQKRAEILANCTNAAERRRTEEIIRPILRGRDVKRYSYEWAGLHLIASHNGIPEKNVPRIDIENYPAIKAHLDSYWQEIKDRSDQGDTPYNLRSCAYMDDFSKPKIVWGDISDVPKFALDAKGEFFCSNTIYFLTGTSLEFLFCYLNSPLSEHLFSKIGSSTGVGTTRWQFFTIEQLFVPRITHKERDEFVRLLSQLRLGRITEPDINRRIYALCELTESEIAFIESESIST
ncbi:MAG TPA: TaqI-like C-terminal specificity domain-containing protein [Verrucomicrobiae bacterium]|nr:TaqI-like C-terminal specificity domain-containing protein [Verrucomicrobiae bacterium]